MPFSGRPGEVFGRTRKSKERQVELWSAWETTSFGETHRIITPSPGLLELESPYMALDSIEGSLKERGVRLTRQRQILLELIDKTGEHLDAESLFQLAKEKDPKLNRVTVYRTLKMLKAGGLVDELDLMHYGGDQHYYETRLKQEHAHVICLRCGKVEEFFGEPLQRLRKQIESHFGFQVLLARTEVGGYCSHCQTLRAREVEELRMLTAGRRKARGRGARPAQADTAQLDGTGIRGCRGRRAGVVGRGGSQRPAQACAGRAAPVSHRPPAGEPPDLRDSRVSRVARAHRGGERRVRAGGQR